MSDNRGMGGFWSELRRRRVMRSGGVYVAAAFVALQLGEIVFPAFDMPDWALRSLVVVAALGLPVVLAIAWVYDLTPEGFERTEDIPSQVRSAIPRIAFLSVTSVAMGFAAYAYAEMTFGPPQTGVADGAASFVSLDEDAPISAIAVLPLDSYVEGDEFFARSLHEEIIAQLAEMTSLRVVSRTSVERYATSDQLLPEIADELRVQAIVEGSVTKPADSDSVRITIQLIHAPSDTHLMARTFEREHRDILRLQREVAQEIATAIQGEVDMTSPADATPLASVDPEAHQAYMLARAEFDKETPEGLEAARQHFRTAIELDSSYSAAYAGLAGTEVLLGLEGLAPLEQVLAAAQEDVSRAVALGGADAETQAVMVMIQDHMEHLPPEAQRKIEIMAPDPDSLARTYLENFTRLGLRARGAMGAGSPAEAARAQSRSRVLQAQRMIADADYRSATSVLRQAVAEHPADVPAWDALERIQVLQGRYDEAVQIRKERLLAVEGDMPEARSRIASLERGYDPSDPSATYWEWVREDHTAKQARGEHTSDVEYAAACVALGDHEDAIRNLESALANRDPALLTLRFDPTWDPLRDDPRFRDVVRRVRAALQPSPQVPTPPGG